MKKCLILYFVILCFAFNTPATTQMSKKVLDKEKMIAFTFIGKGDPKELKSLTFHTPARLDDRKYWKNRGVVPAAHQTWFDLLKSPVDRAVEILMNRDYGGDPNPVVCIDEFGFDFGGETDQKSAKILRITKQKKPELDLTVWQMRGPISHVLAEAYAETVSLVLMEAYVSSINDYWWIATQVYVARMHNLLSKSIVSLGLSSGKPEDKNRWADTEKEIEQQMRFVRLVAPESPGIGFFAPTAMPELLQFTDQLCERFFDFPQDGTGLPEEALRLYRFFSQRHQNATIVSSPIWVEPNRDADDPNILVQPRTLRVYLLNIGDKIARNVKVRLRNPVEQGGDVFADGELRFLPERFGVSAVLAWTGGSKVWKTWTLEIEAEGCAIHIFHF
ncbi:hypothetical protein ACFLRW_04115 [Acidobacteriota bacterium]